MYIISNRIVVHAAGSLNTVTMLPNILNINRISVDN